MWTRWRLGATEPSAVLYTCYPFGIMTHTPQRYAVYADPVNADEYGVYRRRPQQQNKTQKRELSAAGKAFAFLCTVVETFKKIVEQMFNGGATAKGAL